MEHLQTQNLLNRCATNRDLVNGLRSALDRSYSRILRAASAEWQRTFAAKDPSDACVTVRISPAEVNGPRLLASMRRSASQLHQLESGVA